MATEPVVDNNAIPHITGRHVLGGTLVGLTSGIYLSVFFIFVYLAIFVPAQEWKDSEFGYWGSAMFGSFLITPILALAGFIGGFVGSTVGYVTRQRHYSLSIGAIAGGVVGGVGTLSSDFQLGLDWNSTLFIIFIMSIGALDGWLGSLYATRAAAAKPKGCLDAFMIVGLGIIFIYLFLFWLLAWLQ